MEKFPNKIGVTSVLADVIPIFNIKLESCRRLLDTNGQKTNSQLYGDTAIMIKTTRQLKDRTRNLSKGNSGKSVVEECRLEKRVTKEVENK